MKFVQFPNSRWPRDLTTQEIQSITRKLIISIKKLF